MSTEKRTINRNPKLAAALEFARCGNAADKLEERCTRLTSELAEANKELVAAQARRDKALKQMADGAAMKTKAPKGKPATGDAPKKRGRPPKVAQPEPEEEKAGPTSAEYN